MIINEYLPRTSLRVRGKYSLIITEPEVNNCFSLNTKVIISKKKGENSIESENTLFFWKRDRHFDQNGDYRLIIRDREPIRARDFL